ncbi:MAG: hypothetical protein CM15mP103_08340 [Gammaproteobacteria bacterium]|nr:MAG: hypothetical protein CM15mP103_08340 [Gammaproteobacteria bacterium]
MKRFQCRCGAPIFFDNHQCLQCGAQVGFDPESMSMVPVEQRTDLTYCGNHDHGVCNWLRPAASEDDLCRACQFNRTIPNLDLPHNTERWAALERAKKRLFYSLYQLGLPVADGWQAGSQGLLFDFLDDARTQPETYPDTFITSGFAEGVITINVLEADDVARTAAQAELRERYRTLLGHFRHESGHYFWSLLQRMRRRPVCLPICLAMRVLSIGHHWIVTTNKGRRLIGSNAISALTPAPILWRTGPRRGATTC